MAAFSLHSNSNASSSPLRSLFEFLSDFKNFEAILPADRVTDFKHSDNECSFSIKGITPMTVKLVERHPYKTLLFTSEGLGKFNFKLQVNFEGEPEQYGNCRVDLSGDLNPFIKSMAEKPLTDLINTMSLKLANLKL